MKLREIDIQAASWNLERLTYKTNTAYLEWLKAYFDANDVPSTKRVSVLLSVIGLQTYSILGSLMAPDTPQSRNTTTHIHTHAHAGTYNIALVHRVPAVSYVYKAVLTTPRSIVQHWVLAVSNNPITMICSWNTVSYIISSTDDNMQNHGNTLALCDEKLVLRWTVMCLALVKPTCGYREHNTLHGHPSRATVGQDKEWVCSI